ncbi:MAG: DNA photolyase [Rhodospirillaceae bacterium]|nr:DNA photolyase [Rhodospirillaceae bacterium]
MSKVPTLPGLLNEQERFRFTPTREAGLKQMMSFLPRAGRQYANRRNYDFGPEKRNNVSLLSPWIRHRLITEEEIVKTTLSRFSLSTAEKFIQEVFWRSYFKGWLEQHPTVWDTYRTDLQASLNELDGNKDLFSRYEKAVGGYTDLECFNFWVRELAETGYLHNHARMWFASIWIFTLQLPWTLGADFFLRHLLDGDAASNTLGWRWVAGLHTKGKIYLARRDNIRKYTDNRFDPGNLSGQPSPIDEYPPPRYRTIPAPGQIPADAFILLVTDEDCLVSELLPNKPSSTIGFLATEHRSPLHVAEGVKQFARGAIDEALRLVGGKIAGTASSSRGVTKLLFNAAKADNVCHIVMAEPNYGPVKTALAEVENALLQGGLRMHFIRRKYDNLVWSQTDRGFFKLKKKIPELISLL